MKKIKNINLFPVWLKKNKENKKENQTSISSLAPKIITREVDLEKVQPYLDKLKATLNAKGINNIALTGGYGSGKSSLLKTFQHWNKSDYNFLNISLAAFNQTKTKENFKELYELKIKNGKTKKEAEKEISNEFKETLISNEELERQLEISILQQIIYKVKPSNLPESRFKRIVNISKWKLLFLIPFSFILWLTSIILLFKYDYLDNINPNTWELKNTLNLSAVFVFIFAFLGIGYFSKLVVELFSNSKINKVNLKGEIEIGDDSNKSILNEHYDEILYYFEKNNFNVVVIEDLDRFDNTNIFTKLRELNILLNNADTINNRNCYKDFGIKFLYAVGDDLFNDKKERVKFFEYIIPVIPFINSFNANEQLKTLIKESDLEENVFSKEFLSDITTFIDDIDMRLLINIFHEFVIYRNVLKPDVLKGNESELFAMITYKNIDPEDFNKLNNKEGKLYKLINNKKKYTQALLTQINTKIIDRENEIENINNENISDIEELKSIYLKTIINKLPSKYLISNESINDDIFNKIGDKKVLKCKEYDNYYRQLYDREYPIVFSEIENEVNPDFNYNERVELIKSKDKNKKNLLQKEIEKLKSEKSEIENWDLKQIFNEVDINQYLNDFSNNGLLRNLILEGYINENYNDYISLFHEGSITKEDKIFVKNVKSGITTPFDYDLKNIENLIDEIELKYFDRDVILNFDLLSFLGVNYDKYQIHYNKIIQQLSKEKARSIEFIEKYININAFIKDDYFGDEYVNNDFYQKWIKEVNNKKQIELKIFFQKITNQWNNLIEFISTSDYESSEKDKYLFLMLYFADLEDILKQNKEVLKSEIENYKGFLNLIYKIDKIKVQEILKELNVKFEGLEDLKENTKDLFKYVYENNHYQINKENLLQMLLIYGDNKIDILNNIEKSNYSTIINSKCEPLIEYINAEINTYVGNIYLKLDLNINEDEEYLKGLLNNVDLEDKLKVKIIQKVDTLISDLSNIEDIEIKKQLLTNLKVVANWKNVIDYYTNCENKIDEKLIEYLNSEIVSSELSKLNLTKDDIKFELNLVVCNEINDKIYNNLLDSCYYSYPTLSFENVSFNKAVILANRKLTTTKSNYDKLRAGFPDNHITLIERDFNKFFEKIEDFETDEDDILMILKSDKINIDNRFKYISKLTEQTIIDNKAIAKKVGEIILNKSTKVDFEFNGIESIVKNLDSTENKVKFISLYFTELSNDNIISLVKSLSYNHSELFVKRKRPLFSDNSHNRELLTKLKIKRLINSFGNDEKDNSKIRAVANY